MVRAPTGGRLSSTTARTASFLRVVLTGASGLFYRSPMNVRTWILLALFFCNIGCGSGNSLSGSVSQLVSLQFDSVVIATQTGGMAIQYTRKGGAIPAQLAVVTTGNNFASGTVLNANQFAADCTLTRATGDPNDIFPPTLHGALTFNNYNIAAGGQVSGNFSVVFGTDARTQGGLTLLGNFSGNTQIVK